MKGERPHRERFASSGGVNNEATTLASGKESSVKVQPCAAEAPVAIVPISRLKVAGACSLRSVPEPAPQVGNKWQSRVQACDFLDKRCVREYGADAVVQAYFLLLQATQDSVDAGMQVQGCF